MSVSNSGSRTIVLSSMGMTDDSKIRSAAFRKSFISASESCTRDAPLRRSSCAHLNLMFITANRMASFRICCTAFGPSSTCTVGSRRGSVSSFCFPQMPNIHQEEERKEIPTPIAMTMIMTMAIDFYVLYYSGAGWFLRSCAPALLRCLSLSFTASFFSSVCIYYKQRDRLFVWPVRNRSDKYQRRHLWNGSLMKKLQVTMITRKK